jgi:hypothetical protein
VSLFALECDRANGSYRAKRYRGRKFCLGGDFEVSIPYSAAEYKKTQRTVAAKKPLRENTLAQSDLQSIGSTAQHVDPEIGI